MSMFNCSVTADNAEGTINQVFVTIAGYTLIVPVGVCQSFFAFQNWVANNSAAPTPAAGDQTPWTDLMSTLGITMGA